MKEMFLEHMKNKSRGVVFYSSYILEVNEMKFDLDNLKPVIESYDLCLFYDTHKENKIVEVPNDDIIIQEPEPDEPEYNNPTEGDNTEEIPNTGEEENQGPSNNIENNEDDITTYNLEENQDTNPEYEVETITKTKIYKLPFELVIDDPYYLVIKIKPIDLPKIIIENIKLCKDNKSFVTFDKAIVNKLNDIIRYNKSARSIIIPLGGTVNNERQYFRR